MPVGDNSTKDRHAKGSFRNRARENQFNPGEVWIAVKHII